MIEVYLRVGAGNIYMIILNRSIVKEAHDVFMNLKGMNSASWAKFPPLLPPNLRHDEPP